MEIQCWICPHCYDDHSQDYICREKKLAEMALRFREALEAIMAEGWIEGCKTRGEFKGLTVCEIAARVLREHPRENVPIRSKPE